MKEVSGLCRLKRGNILYFSFNDKGKFICLSHCKQKWRRGNNSHCSCCAGAHDWLIDHRVKLPLSLIFTKQPISKNTVK